MNGSAFIINSNGLYCTNDAEFRVDTITNRDDAGKVVSTTKNKVIHVSNFMCVSGKLQRDDEVYCQFKFDEENLVQTFSATISGFTNEMMILNLKALNLRNKEVTESIKNKIKEEISYGS